MIVVLGDQVPGIDSGVGKLRVQIASGSQITETMTTATLHPLQAYLQRRQQDHVVDVGQTTRGYECRQEPRPEDTVIDDGTDVSQPAGSSCGRLDDDGVWRRA